MPQMSPMNWSILTLFLIFLMSFIKSNIFLNKKNITSKHFINKNKTFQW